MPDLSGNTNMIAISMSGIMTIPNGKMAGEANRINRTKGMKGMASGISSRRLV